jgi:L-rhamnose mutarotase
MSKPSRYGFVVNVRPEKREEYLELHRSVWPRVEEAMTENGIRNYSIFVIDNTLFGYFEYVGDDYEADMARIKEDETSQEWWRHTDPCQIAFGDSAPGGLWREMDLAWHMD